MSHREPETLSSPREDTWQRGDHHISAVDRTLRLCEQFRRCSSVDASGHHRAIDLADEHPRAMVSLVARAAAGWGCKPMREITAHDRERADQLASLVG